VRLVGSIRLGLALVLRSVRLGLGLGLGLYAEHSGTQMHAECLAENVK